MKVLTVSHLFPNSAVPLKGIFVAEFTRALSRYVEVEVLAPVSRFPILRRADGVARLEIFHGIRVHHPAYLGLPRLLLNQRWRSYHVATQYFIRHSGFQPEVIHCHWLYPDAYAASRWSKEMGVKTVVTIHGHAALGLGIGGLSSPLYRAALEAMDHVIAVSSELRDLIVKSFGIPPAKVSVLFNGIDTAKFYPQSREMARRNLGLAQNRKLILSVARLSREKRLDLLIDAVCACPRHDFQVCIAGDGPLRANLALQIQSKGLQNRILLLGGVPHEQLPDWYNAADAFCLTSAHEGCPVVVHEALACGIPVVSTRVGAVPDLVHPDFGLLSPPNDVEALASNLETALNRTWDHGAIAAAGQLHTWDAVAKTTVREVYMKSERRKAESGN